MRIVIEGDHSSYHCGSSAVMEVLTALCQQHGEIVEAGGSYDVLVVNGEGTMHHGAKGFHRKMQLLRDAQVAGKATYLVNSVWQDNPSDYDDVLKGLTGLIVRGTRSAQDLHQNHNVVARVLPDLSYWAPTTGIGRDFGGAVTISDIWSEDLGGFVWPPKTFLPDAIRIDMTEWSWGDLIQSLKTSSLFVTGRHHGVYAGIKAEIPMVVFGGNSHKMLDIFETCGVSLPICDKFRSVGHRTRWAMSRRNRFEQIYNYLRAQDNPPSLF